MRFSTIFIGTGILVIISVVLMIGCVAAYDDVNDEAVHTYPF
jgi:TM2 domain-containing membrane protein YozV